MKRVGQVIALKQTEIAEYKRIHAAVWPGVLAQIADSQIRNYSIFLREPENLLFSYFEYHGEDLAADLARMAADPTTQEWWKLTDPMQQRLDSVGDDGWWAPTEEVFHTD